MATTALSERTGLRAVTYRDRAGNIVTTVSWERNGSRFAATETMIDYREMSVAGEQGTIADVAAARRDSWLVDLGIDDDDVEHEVLM